MAKNYFPAQRQKYTYLQTNRSDTLGSIWATMGTDFQSDLNTLRIAPRLMLSTNTAGVANFGLPVAIQYWDVNIFTVAGTTVFKNGTSPNTAFAADASTGAVTNYDVNSDLAVFNRGLWSASATNLYSKAPNGAGTGTWTSRDGSLGFCPHPLVYFEQFNRLYYQQTAGQIVSIDTTNTISSTDYAIALGTGNQVSCMESTSDFIWIGISSNSNVQGSVASILQWDGISPAASQAYYLQSQYVVAMTVYKNIVYIMDGNGVLSKYNGYDFEEIGRLPFIPLQPRSDYAHRNGMMPTRNGTILVNVMNGNAGNTASQYENIPSGVWEWSAQFGFTHKYSYTYLPNGSTSITDYGQNVISAVGAISDVSPLFPSASGRNGSILVGADYYTDATTVTHGLFFDDLNNTLQKKGYFVTTWFFSDEVQDKWARLWAIFKRLTAAGDNIVFKYRTTDVDPLYATITWVDTTHFTTTTNPTAYWTSGTGGEVEIINGTGSASCAHITSIVNNAGTYTVTLDEAVTGVTTGTAVARFQHWVKMFPAAPVGTLNTYGQWPIGVSDTRIQIKGCLTFTGNEEFVRFALFSNEDIKVNA